MFRKSNKNIKLRVKKPKGKIYYSKFLIKIIIVLIIFWSTLIIYNQSWLQLNEVIWNIQGTYPKALPTKLKKSVKNALNNNYININLERINSVIRQNLWVESVYVQRSFWLNITIEIKIKKIALRLNNDSYIDINGKPFNPKLKINTNAPLAITDKSNSSGIYKDYLKFNKILGTSFPIKVIKQNKTTELIIKDDIKIMLGFSKKTVRVTNFVNIYNRLLKRHKSLSHSTIDMRYIDGVTIKFVK